jgi:alkanesulfonate monooxygenase SsuD/methylene tetrahydromethanopterin reductase-like flavin-dependent oxidoreductase (luciferase family)
MIEGQEGVTWEQWLALAEACERSGLEGLFRSDHYAPLEGGSGLGSLDAWAVLAALAARTERIRLGTLVSPVTFRHPSVLARNAVTVDHVSGGRVELGLGAGWNEEEHRAFGFDFPALPTRMSMLEQQLEVVTRQLAEASPAPVQRPRPPIVLGGHAGPRSLRLAVRYADEYNVNFVSPDECAARRARLRTACERAGRDPSTIRLSLMTGCMVGRDRAEMLERVRARLRVTGRAGDAERYARDSVDHQIIGTVEEAVQQLRAYEAAGVERAYLQHLAHEDVEMVELLGAEVAPAVA